VTDWPPRAFLLTAGVGHRLRPLTYVRAKPAVPVAGVPLVSRILRVLHAQGVTEAVLNLHHRPETLTALVGEGRDLGVAVRYSWEQPLLGSAGGPRRALSLIEHDPFLLVNGDTLTNVNLRALWDAHRGSGALVTMALVPNPDSAKYGGVLVDEEGWVSGFCRPGHAETSYHFIGSQVAAHEVFRRVPDGAPAESIRGIYQTLMAEQPQRVRAFVSEASFLDIGTLADYIRTTESVAAAEETNPWMPGKRVQVAASARVTRAIVWNDVTIGDEAVIEDSVVADGVTIPPGASYARCAIVRADGLVPQAGELVEGDLLIAPI
jgi:NDP-sugar pyrophosphorylase family protein